LFSFSFVWPVGCERGLEVAVEKDKENLHKKGEIIEFQATLNSQSE